VHWLDQCTKRRGIFSWNQEIQNENGRTTMILLGRCAWNNCKWNLIFRRPMVLYWGLAFDHGLKRIFARDHEMIIAKTNVNDNDTFRIFRIDWNSNWSRRLFVNKSSATYKIKNDCILKSQSDYKIKTIRMI
jgi:hypothetical protein